MHDMWYPFVGIYRATRSYLFPLQDMTYKQQLYSFTLQTNITMA